MSAGNYFLTRKKSFDGSTLAMDSSDAVSYTIRLGSASDGFIYDRVLNWSVLDFYGNVAVTLPNGRYEGQRVLVNLVAADTPGDTVTVTPATALVTASYILSAVGDYCSLEWSNATGGWVYLAEQTT